MFLKNDNENENENENENKNENVIDISSVYNELSSSKTINLGVVSYKTINRENSKIYRFKVATQDL